MTGRVVLLGATPGVVGPVTAFGPDALRRGCAELGLVTV